MRKIIALAIFGLAVAACGGGSKGASAPKAPTACEQVAERLGKLFEAEMQQKAPAAITSAVVDHCTNDHWSAEATTCIINAQSDEQLNTDCQHLITEDQQQKFKADIDRLMDGMKGEGAGSPEAPSGSPAPGASADPDDGGE